MLNNELCLDFRVDRRCLVG